MARGWRLPFFLAHKAITRGNKGTLGLTILVMSLAFVNLIFMSSILLGLTDTMNNQAIDNMFGHIVIEPEEDEAYIKQLDYHRALIDGTPGVVGSSAHYVVGASIRYDENNDGEGVRTGNWSLKSVNPDDEERVTEIHRTMVAGEYLNASDRNKIVLGKEISGG